MRFSWVVVFLTPAVIMAQEPITGVTAKATSEQVQKLYSAQNLCSDAGLSAASGANGARKLTTNPYADGGSHWQSGYTANGPEEHPLVDFDLGQVRVVGSMHIWNHNDLPHRGFRQVSVMTSLDGKFWSPVSQQFQFSKAPKSNEYTGERHEFRPSIEARYIRLVCESTHRQGGNPDLAGLGKVRFFTGTKSAVPAAQTDGPFPLAAGVINVKKPPYQARGDGLTDDSDAIQRAINDHQGSRRIIYLPAGTYLLSKPLRYQPGRGYGYNNFIGEGRDKTILRLNDATLTDANKPQAVLSLGFNGQPDGRGVHADWFNCNVRDFTINTGLRNPGAIGLQFYSNNVGALRNVKLISPDQAGAIGLDLSYADQNGPCLVKHVEIDGFRLGVRTGATVNSQTAEQITITRTETGWENSGQCLSLRGLKVSASGLGFHSKFGIVCLIDSTFTPSSTAVSLPAIRSGETLFARNIQTTGYKLAIENLRQNNTPTANAPGPKVDEWVSSPPLTLFPIEQPRSLNLPIQETPVEVWEKPESWVNVRSYRLLSDPDDSASFQRAIDSGASTIYFPAGARFLMNTPVELRGQLRHVVGFFNNVTASKGPAIWKTGPSMAKRLTIQDLGGYLTIEHHGPGELVCLNGQELGGQLLGGGDVYLDNIVGDWHFMKGRAWARQFNNEREGLHVKNHGATLWILGYKTERGGTLIETINGQTEVLGGLSYTTTKGKLAPMFTSRDSAVSVVMGEVCYTGDPFRTIFKQIRGDESKTLERGSAPLRPSFLQGSELPLFVAKP